MEKLKKLKKELEGIERNYNYEEYYTELRNAITDYSNDSQDWDFEYLFEDVLDYEIAEEMAKQQLNDGGLIRLYYFLGDANFNNEIFKIDGYGNLTDIDIDDLDYIKDEAIELINSKLAESEDQE